MKRSIASCLARPKKTCFRGVQFPARPVHGLHVSRDNQESHAGKGAFSLVEVVIAMGVLVFAIIGVLVLLGSGLSNYRDAMNSTIASAISQQMISQYMLADFTNVASLPPQTNYFDERGLPVTNAGTSVYQGVANVLTNQIMNVDSTNLLGIHLTITSRTQPTFQKQFTSLIARQEEEIPSQ